MTTRDGKVRTGWATGISRLAVAALLVEAVTGLAVTLAPFHAVVEWSVLLHTALGLLLLVPLTWYVAAHWLDYRRYRISDVVLLGYVAAVALLLCAVSGAVVTWEGLFGPRLSPVWRQLHLWSTVAILAVAVPHALIVYLRQRRQAAPPAWSLVRPGLVATVAVVAAAVGLAALYSGPRYRNEFPADYSYLYGEDRPFAPSLARTASGGAFDSASLANSRSCGTAGCHEQIVAEWTPSAHRYAAMDPLFQRVQGEMAKQNGPESTRYCGGCHDPISLFSGAKNLVAADLSGQHGYDEGVSCLACHGVRETDLQGNANYVMVQPPAYLWQWRQAGLAKRASDFLVRSYPDEHLRLSKRLFKAPEYCAACHKQFIDREVNRVGWVQLQNQYDNWKASHWFVADDPRRTIECRECHMPLVESRDPAAGDDADYNRTPGDRKHRSHRFIAANTMVPAMLRLPGWEEQVRLTEAWLQGDQAVPEIQDKWRDGEVVELGLEVPASVPPGGKIPIRVVLIANKVGHDFPTGPLDIIQSWVELRVSDETGREVFVSGSRDERNFIAPGSFLFKAEPVDQYGNLIDRHNLWEMVGVRYRRALFPGYSDSVEYLVDCPATVAPGDAGAGLPGGSDRRDLEVEGVPGARRYTVTARLLYRKVDQFLVNFLLGENSGVTAPVVEMTRATATVEVEPDAGGALVPSGG